MAVESVKGGTHSNRQDNSIKIGSNLAADDIQNQDILVNPDTSLAKSIIINQVQIGKELK